ncbi:MAG: hypothetical protein JW915_10535 [Chitinispirillaceae bacterium]|nr:hypothetical protein [Chitinispirillaceae bacterium]
MSSFTRDIFMECPEKIFEDLTKSILDDLENLTKILEAEITAYAHNSGKYRTVTTSVRRKETRTIVEKLLRFRCPDSEGNYTKLDDVEARIGKQFKIRDLITDLVGGRIVVYYPQQLKYALRFLMNWPVFEIKQIKAYENPQKIWLSEDLRGMLEGLKKKHGHDVFVHKQKNNNDYESIHILVSIDPTFSVRLNEYLGIKDVDLNELGKYTIEIQIRTLLQHAWAQTEHSLNYSVSKSQIAQSGDAEENTVLREDFAQLKENFRSAESMQALIWNRYVCSHYEITLDGESYDFGDRLSVFTEAEEHVQILRIQEDLIKAVNSAEAMKEALSRFKTLTVKLAEKYNDGVILSSEKPTNIRAWARQRACLLILAYIGVKATKETKELINEFYAQHFKDLIATNVSDNTARLYDSIGLFDSELKHLATDSDQKFLLIDPIVHYRQAYLEYSSGNPTYSLRLIEKTIDDQKSLLKNRSEGRSRAINLRHLYRRRAQCYWSMYLMFADGSDDNLELADQGYQLAFLENSDIPETPKKQKTENAKLSGFYGALIFHRFLYGNKWTRCKPDEFKRLFTEKVAPNICAMRELALNGHDSRGVMSHIVALDYWMNGKKEDIDPSLMNGHFSPEIESEREILLDIKNIITMYDSLDHFIEASSQLGLTSQRN